jgi:hypothetical protein
MRFFAEVKWVLLRPTISLARRASLVEAACSALPPATHGKVVPSVMPDSTCSRGRRRLGHRDNGPLLAPLRRSKRISNIWMRYNAQPVQRSMTRQCGISLSQVHSVHAASFRCVFSGDSASGFLGIAIRRIAGSRPSLFRRRDTRKWRSRLSLASQLFRSSVNSEL